MRKLQQLDVPLLAVPDDIPRHTVSDAFKSAVKQAYAKYNHGRRAGPQRTTDDRVSAQKPRFRVGRGPMSDEERQTFKDAFLGQVKFDDGIR